MQALTKTAREKGALSLVEHDRPSPGPNEALVRVDYAGLCGSDAGIYKWKSAFYRMDLPTIIGHEYTGEVLEVGDNVKELSVGDRVVERPIRSCGECYQCRAVAESVCRESSITGVDHDGAFAGYIAVPAHQLQSVPDDVSPREAAMVEPISIGTRAVTVNSRVRAGDDVLVEGPGPIGQFTAAVARAQGGNVVISGVEPDTSYRLPLAEDRGFQTVNVQDESPESIRETYTRNDGFDVVFDTSGHPSGLEMAVDLTRKGGQIVLIGQTGETTMPYSPLVRAELDVQCSYGASWGDFDRTLALLETGSVDPTPVMDDRYSLHDADQAFEDFLAGETCKPVFDLSELR